MTVRSAAVKGLAGFLALALVSCVAGAQLVPQPVSPQAAALQPPAKSKIPFKMFADERKGEGNYFWLLSGSDQGVGLNDDIPAQQITAHNLGSS